MSITLFSSQTCAECRRVKSWLKIKNLDYKEVLIEDNPSAIQRIISLTGESHVPVIQVMKDGIPSVTRNLPDLASILAV